MLERERKERQRQRDWRVEAIASKIEKDSVKQRQPEREREITSWRKKEGIKVREREKYSVIAWREPESVKEIGERKERE